VINSFNTPDSLDSVALICPKGRAVGTNFDTADTIIVYESHGNMENDAQAAAHCITVSKAKQMTMYRLITAVGWQRAILDCVNGTTTAADLGRLPSRLLACQPPDNEITLVAPIPSSEVREQEDETIEVQAVEPLITPPMKQRARSAVKSTGKAGMQLPLIGRQNLRRSLNYDRRFCPVCRCQCDKQLMDFPRLGLGFLGHRHSSGPIGSIFLSARRYHDHFLRSAELWEIPEIACRPGCFRVTDEFRASVDPLRHPRRPIRGNCSTVPRLWWAFIVQIRMSRVNGYSLLRITSRDRKYSMDL
jgi:hypothetical protein